jgi:hypothetical protein
MSTECYRTRFTLAGVAWATTSTEDGFPVTGTYITDFEASSPAAFDEIAKEKLDALDTSEVYEWVGDDGQIYTPEELVEIRVEDRTHARITD